MSPRAWLSGLVTISLLAAGAAEARARARHPVFDPDDMDMEDPHGLTGSVMSGAFGDPTGTSLLLADLELEYGLDELIELGLDVNLWRQPDGSFVSENGWLSFKALVGHGRVGEGSWSLTLQQGPRLPLSPGSLGPGYGAVLAGGVEVGRWSTALSAGAFSEPATGDATLQFAVLGMDLQRKLDARWTLTGAAALQRFSDGHLFGTAVAGTRCALSERVTLAVLLTAGDLGNGPAVGVSAGIVITR